MFFVENLQTKKVHFEGVGRSDQNVHLWNIDGEFQWTCTATNKLFKQKLPRPTHILQSHIIGNVGSFLKKLVLQVRLVHNVLRGGGGVRESFDFEKTNEAILSLWLD